MVFNLQAELVKKHFNHKLRPSMKQCERRILQKKPRFPRSWMLNLITQAAKFGTF